MLLPFGFVGSWRRLTGEAVADTLITNGLVHFMRFDNGSNGTGSGQTVANYGSNTQTAQLGSTTSADTNDPTWSAVGQTFGGGHYNVLTGGISGLSFATANYTQIFLAMWTSLDGQATSVKRPLIAHAASGDRAGTIQGGGGGYLDARVGNKSYLGAVGKLLNNNWYVVHSLRSDTYGESGINTAVDSASNDVANGTQGTDYRIGASGVPAYHAGGIAAHMVYNRALTGDELLQTYRYLRNSIATPRGITLGAL